ncbi:hypothetical protein L2E82_36446 [Cichorium intybus]|uniref:Uncharacterized protein n=1 Tax=Cichorium intybus TaxID=13427 RepID=A0ACB9BRK1_CICIN|nr:hypothetical protein L2E82_36446 [Cichorium intybus]
MSIAGLSVVGGFEHITVVVRWNLGPVSITTCLREKKTNFRGMSIAVLKVLSDPWRKAVQVGKQHGGAKQPPPLSEGSAFCTTVIGSGKGIYDL